MQKGPSLQQSAQLVHDAGVQLRQLSHELYPPVLMQLGLGPALQDLVGKYAHPGLRISLEGDLDKVTYKGPEASKVYYVVQELLNNVVKHSQATSCTLEILTTAPELQLRLEDNGRGFDPGRSNGTGLGLSGVRARISSLAGKFHLQSRPGAGTRIQIDIPLDRFNT
jgi:signal transduction histidine kinase